MTDVDERAVTRGGMMAAIAERLRMTEGQLYSAVFVALVILLLTLTGLPTAERLPDAGQPLLGPPVTAAPLGEAP